MAKDDLGKTLEKLTETLRKEGAYRNKNKSEEKQYYEQMAENHKKELIENRKAEIKSALMQRKGMTEAIAAATSEELSKQAVKDDKRRQKNNDSFLGKIGNIMSPAKSAEEMVERARREKTFFKSLTSIFKGKKDGEDKGGGMFGKMFKTVKKVFKMISAKFLLIGALVVGLISQMNLDQLKEVWKGLKEAFTAIWEFLEPVIETIWNWIKESAVPALVDNFISAFKSIGELFKNLKERFSGFTEMSWVDRMWAIFGAFEDIGSFLFDMIGNFAVTVEKMFGGDGTWITGIWKDIKGFFSSIGEFLTKLFTNPVETIDGLIMSTFAWIKDIGKWMHETLFTPFVEWFQTLFDFSTIRTTLESLINLFTIIPNTIKQYLLDPAVEWLGKKFNFDSSKFTKFSVGELFTKAMDDVVAFFNNLFNIDLYAIFSDILGKAGAIGKKIWNYFSGDKKKPAPASDYSNLEQTQTDLKKAGKHATIDSYMRSDEYKQLTGGKGKSKKFLERAYEAHLAAPARTSRSATPEWLKKKRAKRLKHKRLAEQHRAGKSGELAQIQADEGFEPGVYKDTMGIKTIGYGFNLERAGSQEALDAAGIKKSLADLKGGKANLTKEEASRLMLGEMGHFQGVAKRFVGESTWKKLSPNRQGILTNMAYNMGEGTLGKFANLKAAIQRGDWSQAQAEMKNSAWAGQVKGRADRLIARMGGEDKNQAFAGLQNQNSALKTSGSGGMTVTPVQIDQSQHNTQVAQNIGVAGDAKNPNPKMHDTISHG